MFDNLDRPLTKKDLLMTLGVTALLVWLSDKDGVEKGLQLLRERTGKLIAGKSEEPEKEPAK